MVTLRVVVDSILEGSPRGIARYTEDLTRALIATAPRDCDVEGIVSASSEEEYVDLLKRLPDLSGLYKTALARRELKAAWQHGLSTIPLPGMIHAPTLLAPLRRHDRANFPGDQVVVTIHDANAWLTPDVHGDRNHWARVMAKRARKYADAIVVPTHAVAEQLEEHVGFGNRIRVIGGAVSTTLKLPSATVKVARELKLPKDYILTVGGLEPRKGLESLLKAAALPGFPNIPLLIVGPDTYGDRTLTAAIADAGVSPKRVRHLGFLTDDQLAVALTRATAFVLPSLSEGFGLTMVEAFSFGTPVIHSDAPALVEVADGAGIVVERDDPAGYPERLAAAVASVVEDTELAQRLEVFGLDRSRAFSWRDSAEKVWQLHADL